MVELKTIKPESVTSALEMAKRYRHLNEPDVAESICLDILAVAPENQEALITLLLALTDKFAHGALSPSFESAREVVEKLDSAYCKSYYTGIIFERRAKYHLRKGGMGSGAVAHEWFVKAMDEFDKAMSGCDPDNQDAVLRWNSCVRFINSHPGVKAGDAGRAETPLDAYE
jgi:hypothetical protein